MSKQSMIAVRMVALALLAAPILFAKDAPSYDKAALVSMESSTCGMAEKAGKTVTGEILGTDSSRKQTQEVLCQEYVLQSDRIVYRIRPNDQKHPVLLPVGESVEFRIHKDKLYLRDPEGDKKEREYVVVSMQPRAESKSVAAN
ncbi:MAG TPA: hypothetical protein VJW93_04385 [Candidatus Acidoferrales bacterium]|nr:hypothetical protein [Candidatus Acidoferrales bacterium]